MPFPAQLSRFFVLYTLVGIALGCGVPAQAAPFPPITWCRDAFHRVRAGPEKPVVLSPEEVTARQTAIEAALAEIPQTGPGKLDPAARKAAARLALDSDLANEGRLFAGLSPDEKRELVAAVVADADGHGAHANNRAEAEARIQSASRALPSGTLKKGAPWGLAPDRMRSIFLDTLHEILARNGTRFSELSSDQQGALEQRVAQETAARADAVVEAVTRANEQSGGRDKLSAARMNEFTLAVLHEEVSAQRIDFGSLPPKTREALADAAVAEVRARLGPVEKALEAGIRQTGKPWSWQLMWNRGGMKATVLEALHKELAKQNRRFTDLTRRERQELAESLVNTALAPYQSRPTLLTTTIGLGVPIAFAYAGGLVMPEAVRPAWYIFTGILSGPFTFGVNYWLNGKLKPFFSVNQKPTAPLARTPVEREVERLAVSHGGKGDASTTPFRREMEGVGAASTGLPDPFKDGRNISKDGELNFRDSLNDAAWRIRKEEDAQKTLAAAVLYHSESFPEVKVNSLLSFLMHMKLKDRFGNPQAYETVKTHIRALAKESSVSPDEALLRLEKVLRPDLWTTGDGSRPFSMQADTELRQMLRRASAQRRTPEEAATQMAWAALFYEKHFPGTSLSQATTFEFYMRTKDRASGQAVYDQARKVVEKEAAALGVSPVATVSRLDAILRVDLWPTPPTRP